MAAPGVWLGGASGGRLRVAIALLSITTACADRGSDIAVVYRGDIAAYRSLVRVQLDSGSRARTVTPAFPSAAHPERVATRAPLPVAVLVLTSAGDTSGRYVAPPLRLAPKTSYQLGVVIGQRPAASKCNGAWAGTALARPLGGDRAPTPVAESLFVSVTANERGKDPPRCDE